MMTARSIPTFLFALLACLATLSSANLTPDGVKYYQGLASEKLSIVVQDMVPSNQTDLVADDCPTGHYLVTAKVVGVTESSEAAAVVGDSLQFQTYYFHEDAPACQGQPGGSPAWLFEGWCGRVFLSHGIGGNTEEGPYYRVAAYGASLEQFDEEERDICNGGNNRRMLRGLV